MKVLLLNSSFYPVVGGIEICIANVARNLTAQGHDVSLFTCRSSLAIQERLDFSVIGYWPGTSRLLNASPVLGRKYLEFQARKLSAMNFDIWHVFMLYPFGWAFADYIRRNSIPSLVSARGADIQVIPDIGYGMRLDPKLEPLIRHAAASYPAVTCLTDTVKEDLLSIGVQPERIRLIPNGVDYQRFQIAEDKAVLRKRLGLPETAYILLSVGRNHPKKNFKALADITARLIPDIPEIHCCLVGDGVQTLQHSIDRQELSSRFTLSDGISPVSGNLYETPARKLIEYYCAADCFLFPSMAETFGMVLIEAMAAGLPIVCADSPGCRDVVRNGVTGLLYPPSDNSKACDNVLDVYRDSRQRTDLVRNARAEAERLDWSNVSTMYLDVYREIYEQTK